MRAGEFVTEGTDRQHLDFDSLYGKVFKIVDNNGNPDNPGFSIVTPLNGKSWNWGERPEFRKIVKQRLNDPDFIGNHKYQQIIDAMSGYGFDPDRHQMHNTMDEAALGEKWSRKYKSSINCAHPKGFSQKAHCAGKRKNTESVDDTVMEMVCEDCGMCEAHADSDINENLRDWFKDKWVRFGPDGKIRGDCARGSESEGKPKCLPRAKANALGKKGRASAAARKRRQDPDANRSGAAINVSTKGKKK